MIDLPGHHWSDFQRQLIAIGLHTVAAASLQYREESSGLLRASDFGRPSTAGVPHGMSFGGAAQEAELADLRCHAEFLFTYEETVSQPTVSQPTALSKARAVDAIAEVLRRRRAVLSPYNTYLSDLARLRHDGASGETAAAGLTKRVKLAGGLAMYYQVLDRSESDPNRILSEIALVLLAAVAQGKSASLDAATIARAQRHLVEYGARGIAALLESWCDLSSKRRVRTEDGQTIHAILTELGQPG
jgi:hypothetical protein